MNQTKTSNQQEQQTQQNQKAKSIGHYVFGKTLGKGTFGKVKLATHILTGEKVAIKILEKSKILDKADIERVTREIQILKQIRHPHVVQLYEIIETPKQLFLIMEFAVGGELFEYIVQNQRIKDLEAARFFNQIISGIEYIHKNNIVHRDMKPENLLLDRKNRLKIVDFGLSNFYKGKEDLLKTACGSPCYAAPEMIAGKKYNGLLVDIWSCGVILFAMLCGYLPFEDPDTSNLYKKILQGEFKIPKYVSNEGKDLIKNILNIDPTKRYGIEDIRKHPFFNLYRQNRIPCGLIIGVNRIPVDQNILANLTQYGFNLDYAQKCIENNRHNHVTTTYHLLLKKFINQGGKSIADIGSDLYIPELIEKLYYQTNNFLQTHYKNNSLHNRVDYVGGSSSRDKKDLNNSTNQKIRNQRALIEIQQSSVNSGRLDQSDIMNSGTMQLNLPKKKIIDNIQILNQTKDFLIFNKKQSQTPHNDNLSSYSPHHNNNAQTTNTQINAPPLPQLKIQSGRIKVIQNDKVRIKYNSNDRQALQSKKNCRPSILTTQNNSIINSPRTQALNSSADNTRRKSFGYGEQMRITNRGYMTNHYFNLRNNKKNIEHQEVEQKKGLDDTSFNVNNLIQKGGLYCLSLS